MHATLEEQMTDKMYSLMNRYNFEALPRSTKLRPLVPEFSHYTYVVTPVQHVDLCTAGLKLFPKEQRCCPADFGLGEFFGRNDLVVNVFVLQAEQFGGECVFWKFLNAIFQMIRRWSAIMWEFHMTLWPFLAKTLEAGHPKDLERHVDPTMHEVLMDNSHRPPLLVGMLARRIHQEVHSTGTNIQSRGAQAETQYAGAHPEVDDWKKALPTWHHACRLGFSRSQSFT